MIFARLTAQLGALARAPREVADTTRDDLAVELAVETVERTRRASGRAQASTRVSVGAPQEAGLPEGSYPKPGRASFEDSVRRRQPGQRFVTQVARNRGFDYAGHHARRDDTPAKALAATRSKLPAILKRTLGEAVRRALR